MKKFYSFVLATIAMLCVGVSNVNAQVTVDGLIYTFGANNKALLSGIEDATQTEISVPATITYNDGTDDVTVKVLGVAVEAFKNNTTLQKVTFAATESADYLHFLQGCFEGCTNLQAVVLTNPSSSASQRKCYYSQAFKNCTSLKQVGATADRVQLGSNTASEYSYKASEQEEVFMGCTSLTGIVFQFYSSNIGKAWFKDCTSLSVTNLYNAAAIGESAFEGCTAITTIQTATTSNNTVNVTFGPNAFKGCTGLTTVYLDQQHRPITEFAKGLFSGCWKLQTVYNAIYNGSAYTYNNEFTGVTSVADSAFFNCQSLKRIGGAAGVVNLPEVKTIGARAFYGAYQMTTLNIPVATTIGTYAFVSNFSNVMSKLATITGGAELTSIGTYAFWRCENLKTIGDTEGLVYLPKIYVISNGVFYNCKAIEAVKMNQSTNYYTYFYASSFRGCSALTKISTKNNARQIGDYAFEGDSLLVGIMNNDNPIIVDLRYATTIGLNAFKDCKSLNTVYIPTAVPTLGNDAFTNIAEESWFIERSMNSYKTIANYAQHESWKPLFDGTKSSYYLLAYVNKSKQYGTVSCAVPLWFAHNNISNIYKVTATSEASAQLEAVSSRTLPANTGVVVEMLENNGNFASSAQVIVLFDGSESDADYEGNLLVANVTENTNFIGHEGDTWNLIMNDGKFVKATDGTLAAGLAYLPCVFSGSEAPELALDFSGSTTGINTIDNGELTDDNAAWYTLNGVRLNGKPAQKGVYIHNGKKIVIK